jgi:hypothetical protein
MDKRYFQFPLCLLGFGCDIKERLNGIISLAVVELGIKRWQKFDPNERRARHSLTPPAQSCTCRINLEKEDELQVVAGCEFLNLICRNVKGMLADHTRVRRFVNDFERRHGTDARVRIRKDWAFETRDNKGMSYPEFAVLAAIYSKIGASRKPVRITQEEIWLRAHGYKSGRVFRAEMMNHNTKAVLTLRRVRSIIERLHARKFFSRTTYARRQTYYSHRLSSTALAQEVFTAKIRRHLARRARISADAELTSRIRAERRKLAGPNATDSATEAPL